MRVLEDHQDRTLPCQRLHLRHERLKRSLPPLRRAKLEPGITSVVRERQQFGKQRGVLGRGRGLREQGIKLVEPGLRRVVVRQPCGALDLDDNRVQRAVRVLR
ncbi:MAG: hypothetical protein WBW74_19550 [Xanthobacteraceae bacterium]